MKFQIAQEENGKIVPSEKLEDMINRKQTMTLLTGITLKAGGKITQGIPEVTGTVLTVGSQCIPLSDQNYAAYDDVNVSRTLAAGDVGHIIAVEGTDGVGKSTFMHHLEAISGMLFDIRYSERNWDRFPNNENPIGKNIRERLADTARKIELFQMAGLYALDRNRYWIDRPDARGNLYVFDRYVMSNLTMINHGRFTMPPSDWIAQFPMMDRETHGNMPSLTILLLGDHDVVFDTMSTKKMDQLEGSINADWDDYAIEAVRETSDKSITIRTSVATGWLTKGQIMEQLLDGVTALIEQRVKHYVLF